MVARPSKEMNGASDVIPGLYSHCLGHFPYEFCVFSIKYFVERTPKKVITFSLISRGEYKNGTF